MTIETSSYLSFSAALHGRVARHRTPVNVTVEVTRRCPLECKHCYNNLPMNDDEAKSGEMTTAEHFKLLDQLAEAGCFWLLFTGGEIFARRDFLEIYAHAKKKGFIITLFTNATLISPKIADALAASRPFAVEVTIYGRTKETYERLTGIPGSYDACLRGIRLLKERGLPLSIKTVAVSINRHEIWEMKRFVEEELGLPFKFDAMMTPRIDCSQSPLAVRLSPEEIVSLDFGDAGRMAEWERFSSAFLGASQPAGQEDNVYHCGGGINSFAVDPAGKMSICVLSHMDSFDVRAGGVKDGWEHFLSGVRDRKISRPTKCTTCQLKSVCGMCPANGELENGDPEAPVDFLCHTAHLRAETFGWAVPAHGACEYCPDGENHSIVAAEGARLKAQGGERKAPVPLSFLPSLGPPAAASGCSTGGCTSCSSR